jgi:hypothetical protein
MARFQFDLARARRAISDPDGAIWAINSFSDADELNGLFEVAVECRLIASPGGARIHVYPLSISDPEPILALDTGSGPSLLGHSLRLREREGENPVEFTLRLLEEVVAEANQLLGRLDFCRHNQPPTSA